ncbi:MAG: leucyl aminopeptidase [Bradymonadia bacterium]
MKSIATQTSLLDTKAALGVIVRFEDEAASPAENTINETLDGALMRIIERTRFKGKPRQVVAVDTLGRLPFETVLLVGLGKSSELTSAKLRDAGAAAINEAVTRHYGDVSMDVSAVTDEQAGQILVGGHLGGYRFDDFQATPEDGPLATVDAFTISGTALSPAQVNRYEAVAEGVCLARKLINEPANICTPIRLADLAEEIAKAPGFSVSILNRQEIIDKGMGGLTAVSQGAAVEPRFIHMSYTPVDGTDEPPIALVGKGLTFDAGGLCIKPAKGMADMYIDMGGSAAVMGAMYVVSKNQPNRAVHGIIGACENMTGSNAFRPSDILTMYSGKTVEVLNTDAEGRLVLADAICYARELEPEFIIDLATLTGACMVGLGPNYAGLFTAHEDLGKKVLDAADRADENLWRLPLDPKLGESLKSKRADITNLGGPYGGAITAAQFLQHFSGDTPWAHLDIAGPTLASKDDGYIRAGGTGYAVMTLVELVGAQA